MELFFDLVYVFAIIQLSTFLAHHLTWEGAVETLVLFGGVWWVWNYTTWATNWIDPDRLPVRVLMVVLMGLSLVMSTAIPEAFGERGLQFAIAVVAMQVIRPLFMVITLRDDRIGRNYRHLGAWSAAAGVLWIAGAFTEGHVRLAIWALALAVDVAGPQFNYWVPGLGSTPMSSWRLSPGHLVERYRLIVIIALGETVLALGREFTEARSGRPGRPVPRRPRSVMPVQNHPPRRRVPSRHSRAVPRRRAGCRSGGSRSSRSTVSR